MILDRNHKKKMPPKQKDSKKNKWRPSIRVYLIFMNLILLCLLFPLVSLFFYSEQAKFRDSQLDRDIEQMRKGLENRSASLARNMALSAGQAIAGYNYTFLKIMVDQVVTHDPEMIYCIIMAPDRKAVVHSDPDKQGRVLDQKRDFNAAEIIEKDFPPSLSDDLILMNIDHSVRFLDGIVDSAVDSSADPSVWDTPVMEALTPIYNGSHLWGVLRCGYSLQQLNEATRAFESDWTVKMKRYTKYLATITMIFFSLGVLVAVIFTRTFVRSMRILSNGVSKVSKGDLDYEIRQEGLVCAEFMDLSGSFNNMTTKLKVSYQRLDEYSRSLEHLVEQRTKELKEAQHNLLQQAHEAGMAEMAVGILHNIGNAITPAKVSTSILLRQLQESAIDRHMQVAINQIHDTVGNLSTLPDAEKERMLAVIKLVPESIRQEYALMIDKTLKIREKHDHIENIINLQMHYARLVDTKEEVDIHQVIDDALKLLNDAIRNRSINIVKNFAMVPGVMINPTKLMQVVVNLIKNGIEAMDGIKVAGPRLEITTCLEAGPPEIVKLSIQDIGVGFTEDKKKKMFSFGYTTKARGGGFGLHSSANYLMANDGTISAHSKGDGQGATFVVGLPVNRIIQ